MSNIISFLYSPFAQELPILLKILYGIGLFVAALIISIIVIRLLQVLFKPQGAAMTIATGNAIIASFPSNERGRALGIMGAVVGLGLLGGPALGGVSCRCQGNTGGFILK